MPTPTWFRATVVAASLLGSGTAFAGGTQTTTQTHHCKMPDGTMDMKKTHKQCTAAKGTWAKDSPTSTTKDAGTTKDAPKAAPKAGTTPAPAPAPKK